jgi:hypothetical protein
MDAIGGRDFAASDCPPVPITCRRWSSPLVRYWVYRICAPRNSLNGFEKLRNSSMNTLAIGFGVRFRSVTTWTGRASVGRTTGNTFIRNRCAPKCSVEPGRMVRKRPVSTSRVRIAMEFDTTCGVGKPTPAARKLSSMIGQIRLSASGKTQGSSTSAASSMMRQRANDCLFQPPRTCGLQTEGRRLGLHQMRSKCVLSPDRVCVRAAVRTVLVCHFR